MKNLALFSIFTILSFLSFGQSKNFIDQPFIETKATVDTLVTPDEIYLAISIRGEDTKGKVPVESLETKMVKALKQLGINIEEDLTLNDLASNFKKYFMKGQDIHKTKNYTLKVHDAVTAGEVILAMQKIEVSNIRLDRTEYSKMETLKLGLKSKAIAKAKRQAIFLVQPIGQKIGSAIHIIDVPNNPTGRLLRGRSEGIMLKEASSFMESDKIEFKNIEFNKIKVESSVSVKFKLTD